MNTQNINEWKWKLVAVQSFCHNKTAKQAALLHIWHKCLVLFSFYIAIFTYV